MGGGSSKKKQKAAASAAQSSTGLPMLSSKPFIKKGRTGVTSDQNEKFRKTMEDEFFVEESWAGLATMVAVFDGHGGDKAAIMAKSIFPGLVERVLRSGTHKDFAEVLVKSFSDCDARLQEADVTYEGSCAVVCVIAQEGNQKCLYSANLGDSRAILGRKGGKALDMTFLHVPTDESEVERIVEVGGFVARGKTNGILRVTRSLGDIPLKSVVINEPYIQKVVLDPTDSMLVLGCDGLFDVVTPQAVIDLAESCSSAQAASDALVKAALDGASTDNISVIVVDLKGVV